MLKNKKLFVPHLQNVVIQDQDFDQLMHQAEDIQLQAGKVTKGLVVGRTESVIIVDVNLKNEGSIPISEFELDRTLALPSIGDYVDVFVESIEDRYGRTVLSREKAIREEAWTPIEEAYKKDQLVDGVIFGRTKGGLTVDLSGVVAFLPGSQIDTKPIKDISHLLDVVQPFQILKMDRKLGNIVVSRRAVLESLRSDAKEELLKNVKVGVVLDGVVKNITDYGAFVDLGSTDGLVHITDIAWQRVHHPSEVLTVGDQIKVVVISFDQGSGRISLGIRQIDESPWTEIRDEFQVGKVIKGRITNIADYGVFVELKNGIDGLVHVSQLSWSAKESKSFKTAFSVGQEVQCVVIDIDQSKYRVSLSIKQCVEEPWQKFIEKNPVGSVIKGSIRTIVNFGIFVAITDDLNGLLHETDLSWDEPGEALLSKYNKGDEIECKILSIDLARQHVSLGVKQLMYDLYETFVASNKVGNIIDCVVHSKQDAGIKVKVDNNLSIFIDNLDLSNKNLSIGDSIKSKIITIEIDKRKVRLSTIGVVE